MNILKNTVFTFAVCALVILSGCCGRKKKKCLVKQEPCAQKEYVETTTVTKSEITEKSVAKF